MPYPQSRTSSPLAYEVYGRAVGYKNFLGQHMPPWDELPETIRLGWVAVARFLALKETI